MKKILIIEDNQDNRENFTEFLKMSGYTIIEASNGKQGVELAKEFIPDLILCDVLMPEMDGYEVLRLLLNTAKTCEIPFIFSTSNSDKVDYIDGMKLGADDYIVKPFEMEVLLSKIEVCLKSGTRRHKPVDIHN